MCADREGALCGRLLPALQTSKACVPANKGDAAQDRCAGAAWHVGIVACIQTDVLIVPGVLLGRCAWAMCSLRVRCDVWLQLCGGTDPLSSCAQGSRRGLLHPECAHCSDFW